MKIKFTAFLLCLLIAFYTPVTIFAYSFKDIVNFSNEIEEVTDLGFIFDESYLHFEPNKLVTRLDIINDLYLLVYSHFRDIYYRESEINIYPDLVDIPYYKQKYLNFLQERNVLDGIVNAIFKPNAPVTYGELATMMIRTLNLADNINILVQENPTQKDYTEIAKKIGIKNGLDIEDNEFVNRETFAKMISNILHAPIVHNNKSLIDTDFKDLHESINDFKSEMDKFYKIMSNPQSAKELEDEYFIDYIERLLLIIDSVPYENINLFTKYELIYGDMFYTYLDTSLMLKSLNSPVIDIDTLQMFRVKDLEGIENEYTHDFNANVKLKSSLILRNKILDLIDKIENNLEYYESIQYAIDGAEITLDNLINTFKEDERNKEVNEIYFYYINSLLAYLKLLPITHTFEESYISQEDMSKINELIVLSEGAHKVYIILQNSMLGDIDIEEYTEILNNIIESIKKIEYTTYGDRSTVILEYIDFLISEI